MYVRGLKIAGWSLLGLVVLYLLAGNLLIQTRLLRHFTNNKPDVLFLDYQSAYTLFPGHANVKGLKLRFQDTNIQFALKLEEATVQISLHELLKKKFHTTRVRATGVSWRMLHKVQNVEGQEQRIAAFPMIFEGPPVIIPPPPGPIGDPDALWSVRLDDVVGEVVELWMLEYRYVGVGHVTGAFELKPLKEVWLAPATLTLEKGTLTAGSTVLSKDFAMKLQCSIDPLDIPASPGLLVLRGISASVQITAQIADLSAAALYQPGLEAAGNGTLTADIRITRGRLSSGSVIEARLNEIRLRSGATGFNGTVNTNLKLAPDAEGSEVPVVHAAAAGSVYVPIPREATVTAAVSGVVADMSLKSADLVDGLKLNWLHTRLEEARGQDARSITSAAGKKAPVLAPAVLGAGPILAAGTADITEGKTLVRLDHASLGAAGLKGAASKVGTQWNGAAAGRVALVPIGLRLTNGTLEVVPLISDGWLEAELERLGIAPAVR